MQQLHTHRASALGLCTPSSDEAHAADTAHGFEGQSKTNSRDFALGKVAPQRSALLFAACTCRFSPALACMTCRRWQRHRTRVAARCLAWGNLP
jgi:hypothetical protein